MYVLLFRMQQFLYIISQKKSGYGVSNNLVLLQDSDTKKMVILHKYKRRVDWKSHPFPGKMNSMNKS